MECRQHNPFNCYWNLRYKGTYQRRRKVPALPGQFSSVAIKWPITREPFKHNRCIGILITCWNRLTTFLLRRHVDSGSSEFHLHPWIVSYMKTRDKSKITKYNRISRLQKHILRLYIAMNQTLRMNVLDCSTHLTRI